MDEGVPDLLPVRAKAVIGPEAHLKNNNYFASSRHLQVGVYNLANLDRRWIRHYQDPLILKMLRDQPNHLQLLWHSNDVASKSVLHTSYGCSRGPSGRDKTT
eukprot:403211-Amphidinium_carterae.1